MNHTYRENTSTCMVLEELEAYETTRRLKSDERKSLREWVADGNSVLRNPFYAYGDDGKHLDFISAYRHCMKEYKKELRKDLREYEHTIMDLTDEERNGLRLWVAGGNSVYDNPCHYSDDSGRPLDYISTMRVIKEQLAELGL